MAMLEWTLGPCSATCRGLSFTLLPCKARTALSAEAWSTKFTKPTPLQHPEGHTQEVTQRDACQVHERYIRGIFTKTGFMPVQPVNLTKGQRPKGTRCSPVSVSINTFTLRMAPNGAKRSYRNSLSASAGKFWDEHKERRAPD